MTKNQVVISAVAVWALMLAATFGFFFWLNDATGQMDWQQYQAMREAKSKAGKPRPDHDLSLPVK